MPATRARSAVPRFDSLKPTPSPPRGTRHNCRTDSPFSDDYETTMPLTVKRKDTQQQHKRTQKPATDPNEIIEISDDDDNEPPRRQDSQTSMIADFRRQINKLREVCGISVQFNGWRSLTRFWWLFVFRKVSSIRKITNELFESSTTFAKKINNCKPFESPVL